MPGKARCDDSTPDTARRRVLIAEDTDDVAEAMCLLLECLGCETKVARDGEQAWEALRDDGFDLAILDIGMPRMDGWEVARRATTQLRSTPKLVALTGYAQAADCARSLEAGFSEHLVSRCGCPTCNGSCNSRRLLAPGHLHRMDALWTLEGPWWIGMLRAVLIYGALLAFIRLSGKRTVGEFPKGFA